MHQAKHLPRCHALGIDTLLIFFYMSCVIYIYYTKSKVNMNNVFTIIKINIIKANIIKTHIITENETLSEFVLTKFESSLDNTTSSIFSSILFVTSQSERKAQLNSFITHLLALASVKAVF